MALTSAATNITASATIVGGVGKVLGDAVIAFNKVNVIAPLVASRAAVVGAKTVELLSTAYKSNYSKKLESI